MFFQMLEIRSRQTEQKELTQSKSNAEQEESEESDESSDESSDEEVSISSFSSHMYLNAIYQYVSHLFFYICYPTWNECHKMPCLLPS